MKILSTLLDIFANKHYLHYVHVTVQLDHVKWTEWPPYARQSCRHLGFSAATTEGSFPHKAYVLSDFLIKVTICYFSVPIGQKLGEWFCGVLLSWDPSWSCQEILPGVARGLVGAGGYTSKVADFTWLAAWFLFIGTTALGILSAFMAQEMASTRGSNSGKQSRNCSLLEPGLKSHMPSFLPCFFGHTGQPGFSVGGHCTKAQIPGGSNSVRGHLGGWAPQ